RYLLDSHKRFKIWRGDNNTLVCGLTAWSKKKAAAISRLDDGQLEELVDRYTTTSKILQDAQLDEIVAEIFRFVGGPLEFYALVEIVATLKGTKDQPIESLDYCEPDQVQHIADPTPRADELLEKRERMSEIWEELRGLPPEQFLAICLR